MNSVSSQEGELLLEDLSPSTLPTYTAGIITLTFNQDMTSYSKVDVGITLSGTVCNIKDIV